MDARMFDGLFTAIFIAVGLFAAITFGVGVVIGWWLL